MEIFYWLIWGVIVGLLAWAIYDVHMLKERLKRWT